MSGNRQLFFISCLLVTVTLFSFLVLEAIDVEANDRTKVNHFGVN